MFGQNLIALNSGQIKQGEKLTVISKQEPPTLVVPDLISKTQPSQLDTKNKDAISKTTNKNLNIFFEKWNKNYQVPSISQKVHDKQKTLLENGEDAGLILPYSCRAGMCGRCKAKLISGNVKQFSCDGLTVQEEQDGYILCCNAIATSDVVIKHD